MSASLGRRAAAALVADGAPYQWAYLGENTARMLEWRARWGAAAQLPLGRRTVNCARAVRASYVGWIGELGAAHRDDLHWGVSEISERNIYRDHKLLLAFAYLTLWRELLTESRGCRLLVVVESTVLAQTLAANTGGRRIRTVGIGLRRRLRHVIFPLRLAAGKVRYIAGRFRHWLLARWDAAPGVGRIERGRPVVLIHTWAGPAATPGGPFTEGYFGPLPAWLAERGEHVALVPWYFYRTPHRTYLAEVARSPLPAVVPERVLSLGDMVRAALGPVVFGWLPRGRAFTWDGFDVSPLVRDARRQQVASFRTSDALLHYYFARRLAAAGVAVSRVLHIHEAHGWEKALALGARRFFPGAEVVGFQHNALSEFETNYYRAPAEAGSLTLPDRVVCQGPAWARVLGENGYGPPALDVGAALRFTHLFAAPPAVHARNGAPPTVLVTLAVDLHEALDTLVKSLEAFASERVRVLVKAHPLMPRAELTRRALAALGLERLPEHVTFVDGRLADWMPAADLLVYGSTTTGWEAVVAGVPAVFVGRDCGLSFDPVRVEVADKRAAFTAEELRAAAGELLARGAEAAARARATGTQVLHDWFCPVEAATLAAFCPAEPTTR